MESTRKKKNTGAKDGRRAGGGGRGRGGRGDKANLENAENRAEYYNKMIGTLRDLLKDYDGKLYFYSFIRDEFGAEQAQWLAEQDLMRSVCGDHFYRIATESYNSFFTFDRNGSAG